MVSETVKRHIEYDGLDVTYTVKQIYPDSNYTTDTYILTAKAGQIVYIESYEPAENTFFLTKGEKCIP